MTNPAPSDAAPSSNLLHGSWTHETLRDVLARHPPRPLLPALGSDVWRRAALGELGRKLGPEIRALADAECDAPLPALPDDLYAEYHRSGIRVPFEAVYFDRRHRLAHAALALLLAAPDDPARARLTSSFLRKLEGIFAETSWALPAHVQAETGNPSGKEPLCIDLFSCETAHLMVDLLEVFGAIIPGPLQTRIRERLQHELFENYLARDHRWLRMTNNWNAVCHQGVIGSALALSDDADLLAAMLQRARASLPVFLSGFSSDGGCSEGPTYWKYGFGWLALLNERLEHRTAGELSLFAGDEFVRALARFGPSVSLSGGHLVNFSDCAPSGGLDPAILAYLGQRLDEDSCRSSSAHNYHHMLRHGVDWTGIRTDFLHISRWLLRFPETLPAVVAPPADRFLPALAQLIARGVDARGHLWEFAAKGGHNDEQHNHNDCGSFLLNIDGRRVLAEIGACEYVRDYFDSTKRYGFLAPRSLGHSVPLVGGHEQAAGARFAARILSCSLTPGRAELSMDLSACYPEEARCRRLVRTFVFEKEIGRLTLVDDYELEAPAAFASTLICLDEPSASSETPTDLLLGAAPPLRVTPGRDVRHLGVETCLYHDKVGKPSYVRRLTFAPAAPVADRGRLELVFTLA